MSYLTIILTIWLLLTLPIMRAVEKKLGGYGVMTFLYTLCNATWNVPRYYYLTIKELITKK